MTQHRTARIVLSLMGLALVLAALGGLAHGQAGSGGGVSNPTDVSNITSNLAGVIVTQVLNSAMIAGLETTQATHTAEIAGLSATQANVRAAVMYEWLDFILPGSNQLPWNLVPARTRGPEYTLCDVAFHALGDGTALVHIASLPTNSNGSAYLTNIVLTVTTNYALATNWLRATWCSASNQLTPVYVSGSATQCHIGIKIGYPLLP